MCMHDLLQVKHSCYVQNNNNNGAEMQLIVGGRFFLNITVPYCILLNLHASNTTGALPRHA